MLHEKIDDGVKALVFAGVAVLAQKTSDGATDVGAGALTYSGGMYPRNKRSLLTINRLHWPISLFASLDECMSIFLIYLVHEHQENDFQKGKISLYFQSSTLMRRCPC